MSKIEKLDSLASWGGRIFSFIWGNKVISVGVVMSFTSSLFAPIISFFGLPATIILITGLGLSTILLAYLLWRKFIESKKLKNASEMIDLNNNSEREKRIDELLLNAVGSQNTEKITIYSQVMILAREFPDIKKRRTEDIAKEICGENATQGQKSAIYTLLEKYEPFRDKVNYLLATKATKAIQNGSISKQSIEFLSSITDDDLEILKKQFKYVLCLPHQDTKAGLSSVDLMICNFENYSSTVQHLLLKDGQLIHLESWSIDFYGQIWLGQSDRASFYTPKEQSEIINAIDSNKLFDLQISLKQLESKEEPLVIKFEAYVCLTKIGIEIFNLLKDELESTPKDYLDNVIQYWNIYNNKFNFSLLEKTKLITDDNP